MSLKVTLADIAKELNTTAATVSRALKGDPSIGKNTRQRIAETARRLNYKPHRLAASLRKGNSGLIGVIIPSAEINFFGSVVHGIENLANQNGFQVLIYQSNESLESEIRGIEALLSTRVDGILVSISKSTQAYQHFEMVKEAGVPIVFFDRAKDDLGIHSVVIDDFKGGYLATRHLIEQGYRCIAHISGPQHLDIFRQRQLGYQHALSEAGLPVKDHLIVPGMVSIDSGRTAAETLLQLADRPDAIFAVEDFTALGALKAIKEKRLRVPEDIGIAGFANEQFGEHITPTLTTIDQQTVNMGTTSMDMLMTLIRGNNPVTEMKKVLEPVLIIRESSNRNNNV
jgi:LacI family transcriptional regulator